MLRAIPGSSLIDTLMDADLFRHAADVDFITIIAAAMPLIADAFRHDAAAISRC